MHMMQSSIDSLKGYNMIQRELTTAQNDLAIANDENKSLNPR